MLRLSPRLFAVLFMALLFMALGSTAAAPLAAQQLEAKLDAVYVAANGSEAKIRFTLTNRDRGPVQILHWFTPLEGFRSRLFQVECDGRPVEYVGPLVKRSSPRPDDYASLAAGESVSAVLDLATAYRIERPESCQVRWLHGLTDVVRADRAPTKRERRDFAPIPLRSNALSLSLGRGSVSFKGCGEDEKLTLRTSLITGGALAESAQDDLEGIPEDDRSGDVRYKTWFGTFSSGRYNGVVGVFDQVHNAAGGDVKFDCTGVGTCGGVIATCNPGDFAFTCAGGANQTIWPCESFWVADPTGQDSQAGTIVHELTHWFGIDDIAGGATCSGSQQLARSSAAKAVDNANNYEYFAENFGLVCN